MNINYDYHRSLESQQEFDKLVEEFRRINPPKPKPIKPQEMSDEEFILAMQGPTTKATLMRSKEEQAKWLDRPLPTNWKAVPNAKTDEERVGARTLRPDEVSHIESIRRRPKNSLGQSTQSSVSDLQRERGVAALLYTPPARPSAKEIENRAVNLVQYKSEPLKEVWIEMPWYKALFHWARGNKIKVD